MTDPITDFDKEIACGNCLYFNPEFRFICLIGLLSHTTRDVSEKSESPCKFCYITSESIGKWNFGRDTIRKKGLSQLVERKIRQENLIQTNQDASYIKDIIQSRKIPSFEEFANRVQTLKGKTKWYYYQSLRNYLH